ncbi:MAG: hypothetical protein AAGE52_15430 [Myxococcota bacterium]
MSAKIIPALRALGILGGVWGILGLVGFLGGAIPPAIAAKPETDTSASEAEPNEVAVAEEQPSDDAPSTEEIAEAAPVAPASETPQTPQTTDDGPPAEPSAPAAAQPLWRVQVAQQDTSVPGAAARLTVANVVGDAEAEVLVACGDDVHVLGFVNDAPLRVLRWRGNGARPVAPLVAPLVGGDRSDVILGSARLDSGGNPTGGELRFSRATESGGFGDPERLADAPVVAATYLSDASLLGLVTWPDAHGVRPSELWIVSGGASPSRRARARLGFDGSDVVTFDLDGDGEQEFVTIDGENVRVFAPSGQAGPVLDVPRGRRLLAVDGELYALGDGLFRVTASETTPIDGPHGIRSLIAHDVDGDGRKDFLAATRGNVVLLRRASDERFEERALITLPGTLRPHDLAVWRDQLVIVVASVRGWELLATPLSRVDVPAAEAGPLSDAPLVLTFGG